MTEQNQKQLGTILWAIADQLRGAMNADDFRDYMLSFLFLRYLSDNYETAAQKELGSDYPDISLKTTPSLRDTPPKEGNNSLKERKNSPPSEGWQAKPDGVVSTPLQLWYDQNPDDIPEFEKQMRRKVHYVIEPQHLWGSIAEKART